MSNSQVAQVRKGVRFIDREGVRWTATTDARPADGSTNYEVWLVSGSGNQVMRMSHHNSEHLKEVGR